METITANNINMISTAAIMVAKEAITIWLGILFDIRGHWNIEGDDWYIKQDWATENQWCNSQDSDVLLKLTVLENIFRITGTLNTNNRTSLIFNKAVGYTNHFSPTFITALIVLFFHIKANNWCWSFRTENERKKG